jgi:hypothetical protein
MPEICQERGLNAVYPLCEGCFVAEKGLSDGFLSFFYFFVNKTAVFVIAICGVKIGYFLKVVS